MTWPRPTAQELAQLYDGAYYEERGMGPTASSSWHERAEELLECLPGDVRSVLDWGAGLGHLVAALRRRGIEAEGVEPSLQARELALKFNGVALLAGLPVGRAFDAVTLYHSLEHTERPREVLVGLREHLVPRGILFIEVPHVGSADMFLPALRRQILSLPHHLFHFTPSSLSRLLASAGYVPLRAEPINPRFLELLMEWRARRRETRLAPKPGRGGSRLERQEPDDVPSGRVQVLWRKVLAVVRGRLPGWRFQMTAKTLEDGQT